MGFGLECFGIELFSPVQRFSQKLSLMLEVCIGSVLRQHQFHFGVFRFQMFYPGINIPDFLFVPAEIAVHALDVSLHVHRMFGMAIAVHGYSVSSGIFRLSQVVQRAGKLCRIGMGLINFVVQSPDVDGRMVETLADQFVQLVVRIFPLFAGNAVYEWYFGPNDQSQTVAARIEVL